MSDAEIKATASLDDKLSPALDKISAHLDKFSLSAEGITSKLARSFSLTDLAVGALVGSFASLVAQVNASAEAYTRLMAKYSQMSGALDSYTQALRELNDEEERRMQLQGIGAANVKFGMKAAGNAIASTFTGAFGMVMPFQYQQARDAQDFMSWQQEQADKNRPTSVAVPDAWREIEQANKKIADERERAAKAAEREAAAQIQISNAAFGVGIGAKLRPFRGGFNYREDAIDPADPYGTNKSAFNAPSNGSRDGEFGAMTTLPDNYMKGLDESAKRMKGAYDKMQGYTNTLAQGLSATFSGMLFDGMKLSDGLKNIFRGLVDDILGELSAKAASSIVKAVLTLADTGGGAVGVQVGPAAMNTTLQTLDYQRARGR